MGYLLALYQGSVPVSPQLPEDSTLENKLAQMYSCDKLLMSYNFTDKKLDLSILKINQRVKPKRKTLA